LKVRYLHIIIVVEGPCKNKVLTHYIALGGPFGIRVLTHYSFL